jgi:hypothetical protein
MIRCHENVLIETLATIPHGDDRFRHSSNSKDSTSTHWEVHVFRLSMRGIYEISRWDDLKRYDISAKIHDDRSRHWYNIKIISTFWEAAVLVFPTGHFIKYAVEMTSVGMIYIPNFTTIGSDIQVIWMFLSPQFWEVSMLVLLMWFIY